MNVLNKITDKEFIPFLQSLGVDTFNKSFEWMLNDPNFSGVLEWMYNSLDYNNVLSPREISRYSEIEKTLGIITTDELDTIIECIKNDYPGICLPGNHDEIEDMKLDINMQKEKLGVLEKQEKTLKELIKQNESTSKQLNLEVIKLNRACQQCIDEEKVLVEECKKLAEEVETMTDEVIEVIAKTMDVYSGCWDDKDAAKKFYTFGPFDKYKKSQDLFQGHFDLFASKKFQKKSENNMDSKGLLNEARVIEARLIDAIMSYVESEAELSGEQAKLSYVTNYNAPHSSQINSQIIEAQSAVQLLEQEEAILDSQVKIVVKQYAEERTALVEETVAKNALAVREEVHTNLTHLLDTTEEALALDKVLYAALRYELRYVKDFLLFATQLREYVIGEAYAVDSRINSMYEICNQQNSCEGQLLTSDMLIQSLAKILGTDSYDAQLLIKLYNNLQSDIIELNDNIEQSYRNRVDALEKFKSATKSLHAYIWDGCTKQPNTIDKTVSSLTHSLRQEMTQIDNRVIDATSMFKSVKNSNGQELRKLWQWFLTDPAKLQSSIKAAQYMKESTS